MSLWPWQMDKSSLTYSEHGCGPCLTGLLALRTEQGQANKSCSGQEVKVMA